MVNREENILTRDTFYKGKVLVNQYKKGYRFCVDAPILASFIYGNYNDDVLEIGTGSGIISLLNLYKNKFRLINAIEVQDDLINLAKDNFLLNEMDGGVNLISGNVCDKELKLNKYDIIYSNPPFFKSDSGILSKNFQVRIAKFDIFLTLEDLILAFKRLLKLEGKAFMIYPYSRFNELKRVCDVNELFINKLRRVYTNIECSQAVRILVQLSKSGSSYIELENLYIYEGNGNYTDEMQRIICGG